MTTSSLPPFCNFSSKEFTYTANRTGDKMPLCRIPASGENILENIPFQLTVVIELHYQVERIFTMLTGTDLSINFVNKAK